MRRSLLAVLVALATLGWACAPSAQGTRTTVLSVGDGDTIRVNRGGSSLIVRIACIDAPELEQRPWGERARRSLRQRLPLGREVTLDVKTTDRFGRTVAEVISDGNIGLAMVEDGQAFAFRRYLNACVADDYLQAEQRARRRRHGLWQEEGGGTRPWVHRRHARPAQAEQPPQAD